MKRSVLARTAPLARKAWARAPRVARPLARPRVTPEERRARALVTGRAQGRCEGCGRAGQADWSHRIARARVGVWCPSNGIALCRPCHQWAHDQPIMARSVGWILRAGHDPATVPALLHVHGWVQLTADGDYLPHPKEETP